MSNTRTSALETSPSYTKGARIGNAHPNPLRTTTSSSDAVVTRSAPSTPAPHRKNDNEPTDTDNDLTKQQTKQKQQNPKNNRTNTEKTQNKTQPFLCLLGKKK